MSNYEFHVVVGGQFGSEGKGAIAAHLTRPERFSGVAVRVAGPNAGHTAVDSDGRKWPLRCVPVAAVTNPDTMLMIAAGSEVDPTVLEAEVEQLEQAGHNVANRLMIDQYATIIEPEHQLQDEQTELVRKTGSTNKGIGAARVDRLRRIASTVSQHQKRIQQYGTVADTPYLLRAMAGRGHSVLIEGTQGYGLGLHTKYYPHTTSQDCRAIDFMAQAGVSPWSLPRTMQLRIWVTVRPNPIRIAGNSGPLKGESTWEALGLPTELTTVTRKPRRVGEWDTTLVVDAVVANGGGRPGTPVQIALTMADHIAPRVAGSTDRRELRSSPQLMGLIEDIEHHTNTTVALVGTSDRTVIELAP